MWSGVEHAHADHRSERRGDQTDDENRNHRLPEKIKKTTKKKKKKPAKSSRRKNQTEMTVKIPIAMVVFLLAVLAFSAAPALATPPENPEVSIETVTLGGPTDATSATFKGVLEVNTTETGRRDLSLRL